MLQAEGVVTLADPCWQRIAVWIVTSFTGSFPQTCIRVLIWAAPLGDLRCFLFCYETCDEQVGAIVFVELSFS